jgi:ubiquitin thioesterase OTU1
MRSFYLTDKPESNQSSSFMRELVASTVMNQPDQYNEGLLGKPNKEYKKWILQVIKQTISYYLAHIYYFNV